MKRLLCVLLAVLMLILTACTPTVQQKETTVPTETTTAPTETTDPEETTDPDTLSAVDCLLDELPVMSYEEYFAEDRRFCIDGKSANNRTWSYPYGDSYILYKADHSWNPTLTRGVIEVSSELFEFDNEYTVPCEKQYPEHSLLAADGKWAYLFDATEILQVDMHTGEVRQLVSGERLLQADICGKDLLYYACVEGDNIHIHRLYIPTMRTDCLYDDISSDIPWDDIGFKLYQPESTLGNLVWRTISPEMVALMKKELSDPNSPYRANEELSVFWDTEDPFQYKYPYNQTPGYVLTLLMEPLEEKTGVSSYLICVYNPVDKTYSEYERTATRCGACYGDTDHVENWKDPVLSIGQWMDTAALTAPTELNTSAYPYWDVVDSDVAGSTPWFDIYNPYVMIYPDRFEGGQLYRNTKGVGERLTDLNFLGMKYVDYDVYGVTDAHMLVKIDGSTGEYKDLYPAQHGRIAMLETGSNQMLYFLDGDTLMQLDAAEGKVRTLIEHLGQPCDVKFREDFDDSNILCLTVYAGDLVGNYRMNLQTGEVTLSDDNIIWPEMG